MLIPINLLVCTSNRRYVGPNRYAYSLNYVGSHFWGVTSLAYSLLCTSNPLEPLFLYLVHSCMAILLCQFSCLSHIPFFDTISIISWVLRNLWNHVIRTITAREFGRSLIKMIWHNKYVSIIWIGYNSKYYMHIRLGRKMVNC